MTALGIGAYPGIVKIILALLFLGSCLRIFHTEEAVDVSHHPYAGENPTYGAAGEGSYDGGAHREDG